MTIETVYLMTENGRFVCTDQFGDLTIKKQRADASCKQQAGWGDVEPTVELYNPAAERWWAVAPDLATPHVDDLVTARKNEWTTFNYAFVDAVARKNVEMTVANIRKDSPVLADLESKGSIKIAGAMYNLESGAVEFFA